MTRNELIEEIVWLIFDGKVDLDDPSETIKQIKKELQIKN